MPSGSRRLAILLGSIAVAALVLAGCSSGDPTAQAEPAPGGDTNVSENPGRPDLEPLIRGPVSDDGFQAILGTIDLGVGSHRVGFLVTSPQGVVDAPTAEVSVRRPARGALPLAFATALYNPWPLGERGLYATDIEFDEPGAYALDVDVEDRSGALRRVVLEFDVRDRPRAPDVGDPAPPSETKTLAQTGSFDDLTTGSTRDPDFYQLTLAEAVRNELPTVVVFASPAFCTNAVCGPQIDVLQELKNAHPGQANFVHVDFFDNPKETQDDLDAARLSPAVVEWSLPGIEWTFVIDREGVVASRFEAFVTFAELEAALGAVL